MVKTWLAIFFFCTEVDNLDDQTFKIAIQHLNAIYIYIIGNDGEKFVYFKLNLQ